MNKHSIAGAIAALMLAGASTMASAQDAPAGLATLSKAEGTVMVDHGKGFVTSTVNATLNEGDRVITLDGSGAEIVFGDGCKSQLKANHMIVISAAQGCKAAIASVDGAKTAGAEAAGAGSGTPTAHVVGPLLVGGVVFAVASNWEDDDTPISAQ